jgi:hypothetical protein
MGFKDMVAAVSADAKGVLDVAGDKLMQWLDEYKKATGQLEVLGFKVGNMTVGMGVLPEVHTSFIGEIDNVDVARLTTMMEQKKDDKLLVALIKALLMAKKVHGHVDSKLKAVTLHATLGLPPSVSVELS